MDTSLGGCIVDVRNNQAAGFGAGVVLTGSALRELRDRLRAQAGVSITVQRQDAPDRASHRCLLIRAWPDTPGKFAYEFNDGVGTRDRGVHGDFDLMFDVVETLVAQQIVEETGA